MGFQYRYLSTTDCSSISRLNLGFLAYATPVLLSEIISVPLSMPRKYFFPAIDCILWRIHYFIFLLAVWLLLPCITVDERLLISQDLGPGALSSSGFGVHHAAIMDGRLNWTGLDWCVRGGRVLWLGI
jgi:hypothetical protein